VLFGAWPSQSLIPRPLAVRDPAGEGESRISSSAGNTPIGCSFADFFGGYARLARRYALTEPLTWATDREDLEEWPSGLRQRF
jgi:hypothetical protein